MSQLRESVENLSDVDAVRIVQEYEDWESSLFVDDNALLRDLAKRYLYQTSPLLAMREIAFEVFRDIVLNRPGLEVD